MKVFHCPTKLYAGEGALDALALYPAKRVLVITDSYFSKTGWASQIGNRLPNAQVRIFDGVIPDPPAALAAEGAAICMRFKPDLLIALGGGSVMDCAKAVWLASDRTGKLIAIPTTSGSGSEMTSFSILTHEGNKHPLVDPALRPDGAILDPALLAQLPKSLIADTGMDLLAHCLEALCATGRSNFTDAMAMRAAQIALEHLGTSFLGERSVRIELHEAASMAGMAFDQAGLGVCHALAHAIGGVTHVPHGRLCGILLPAVMDYNAPAAIKQYVLLAKSCGITAASERLAVRQLVAALIRLRKTLQLPETLMQAGISRTQWMEQRGCILENALQDPCCRTNPVPVTPEDLARICEAVLG